MSEHSCAEILSEVYQFIDGELTEGKGNADSTRPAAR